MYSNPYTWGRELTTTTESHPPKPTVKIFNTHKKAHVKWASSGFIFMF